MKLIEGKLYKVSWIDAFGTSEWTDKKQLDELVVKYEKPVEQILTFIKETNYFYVFTSGRHTGDQDYPDIHFVPKEWAEVKLLTKKDL